jgi:hypothetical protein
MPVQGETSPQITLISVDFPTPFGPTRATCTDTHSPHTAAHTQLGMQKTPAQARPGAQRLTIASQKGGLRRVAVWW